MVHGSRPPGSSSPKSTSASARPPSWPGSQPQSTAGTDGAHDTSTGEPASTTTTVRGWTAATASISSTWRPGSASDSRSRPSVSQSPSRPTTTTAASAAAAAATARSNASSGSGGAHRSSAASRWRGSSRRTTSSSRTGSPGGQLDRVADRRAVGGERGLAVGLHLEAVGAGHPRRERGRCPRRPAGSAASSGVVEEQHPEVARPQPRRAPRRRRRRSRRRRPACRRRAAGRRPSSAGVPRLAPGPGSTDDRRAEPLAQPVGHRGHVGGRDAGAATALDHLAIAVGADDRDVPHVRGQRQHALVAQQHERRGGRLPRDRDRARSEPPACVVAGRCRSAPVRRPRRASRSRFASMTSTGTSPASTARGQRRAPVQRRAGHLEVEAGERRLDRGVHREPVGDHHAVPSPLVAQDRGEQPLVLRAVRAVEAVVGGHRRPGTGAPQRVLERQQRHLPQRALVGLGGDLEAVVLLVVGDQVLDARRHPSPCSPST